MILFKCRSDNTGAPAVTTLVVGTTSIPTSVPSFDHSTNWKIGCGRDHPRTGSPELSTLVVGTTSIPTSVPSFDHSTNLKIGCGRDHPRIGSPELCNHTTAPGK